MEEVTPLCLIPLTCSHPIPSQTATPTLCAPRCIPSLEESRAVRFPAPCAPDSAVHCMAVIPPRVSASGSLEVRAAGNGVCSQQGVMATLQLWQRDRHTPHLVL